MNLFNICKTAVLTLILSLATSFAVSAAPIAVANNETTAYLSIDSSESSLGSLVKDETVNVLEINGNWAVVSNDRFESAFVMLETLNFIQADARVNADVVNVRTKPSLKGKILGQVKKDDIVQAVSKIGDWYSIIYNGEKAYIYGQYIEAQELGFLSEEEFVEDTSLGEQIAEFAVQFIGTPYVYGGTSLTKGIDCSGFTQAVYKEFGYYLNRVAAGQFSNGVSIEKDELQAGDLIFFSASPGSNYITHVVMYIGDGNFVHSSTPESGGVRIDSLSLNYFKNRYVGARRII